MVELSYHVGKCNSWNVTRGIGFVKLGLVRVCARSFEGNFSRIGLGRKETAVESDPDDADRSGKRLNHLGGPASGNIGSATEEGDHIAPHCVDHLERALNGCRKNSAVAVVDSRTVLGNIDS